MNLVKDFNFSTSDIESLYPFEYKVYVNLILEWIKEEEKRVKEQSRKIYRG
jgi:hypothetical protein